MRHEWPLVWRSHAEADLAAAKAEADRQRARAEEAVGIAGAEVAARRALGNQLTDLDVAYQCLARTAEANARHAEVAEAAAGIDRQRARKVGDRWVLFLEAPRRARREQQARAEETAGCVS